MEFVEGGQVNDLDYIKKHKINPYEVSDKLGKLYSKMIFIHGFVHSDPHPGNILVRKTDRGDCDIVLLDHGLYAVSSDIYKLIFWLFTNFKYKKIDFNLIQSYPNFTDFKRRFACRIRQFVVKHFK